MKFGLSTVTRGVFSSRENYMAVAKAAERAGFDFLSVSDHLIVPAKLESHYPYTVSGVFAAAEHGHCFDQLATVAFLAGCTERLRLLTSVLVVPHRPAVLTAKILATIDVLSNGRLIFGLGVGWCEPEMRSVGAPFAERGRVADDYLAAMRAVWTQPKPSYRGPYVAFDGVQAMPRPVQTPVPIVVGGRTAPAYRRAVTQGHGWYGFGINVEDTQKIVATLRDIAKKHSRPAELGRLEISVTPPSPEVPDAGTVDAYAAAGVDRLIIRPKPDMDAAALERFAADAGHALIR